MSVYDDRILFLWVNYYFKPNQFKTTCVFKVYILISQRTILYSWAIRSTQKKGEPDLTRLDLRA